MSEPKSVSRRAFLGGSLAAAGALGAMAVPTTSTAAATPAPADAMPCGTIGKARISRVLLGGNLISGCMHARDLAYVGQLFRAYVNEDKILETLRLAEQHGINTVFETGASYIQRYNRECGGHMQFIPHIEVSVGQKEGDLEDHIQRQVDSGAVALYVWGVAGDKLVQAGEIDRLARAVDLAKAHDLPVGVGGHSLLVPMACEKHKVPCDFYVKTFHRDDYPSATPKELRKEFIWLDGGKGWYDNMWCINPEETIAFMKTVAKPWIAFKILAAGGIRPRDGLKYAFDNGADLAAVGMFDFQIAEDCQLARAAIRAAHNRPRPWRA
ncbi:MAG TPA: hypothetical protein VM238_00280 [Phycisphaerae bacterium]|nr:hypothetical protein [Phycisphaerae bacterium]